MYLAHFSTPCFVTVFYRMPLFFGGGGGGGSNSCDVSSHIVYVIWVVQQEPLVSPLAQRSCQRKFCTLEGLTDISVLLLQNDGLYCI